MAINRVTTGTVLTVTSCLATVSIETDGTCLITAVTSVRQESQKVDKNSCQKFTVVHKFKHYTPSKGTETFNEIHGEIEALVIEKTSGGSTWGRNRCAPPPPLTLTDYFLNPILYQNA